MNCKCADVVYGEPLSSVFKGKGRVAKLEILLPFFFIGSNVLCKWVKWGIMLVNEKNRWFFEARREGKHHGRKGVK